MTAMSLEQFRSRFRGEIIQPGDAAYESARKVYNGMVDKRPKLIARAVDVADVMAAVNYGRENSLLTAIRGGGHNAAGTGTCDNGLVIDLSRMKGVRVDAATRTVRVAGGCVWGDVDHATHPFGLAVPCGFISSTGVAGLTLGGGIGYLSRRYGLTIDNLVEADVVLADGRFVTASEADNPDLFWALRGGGGNFGVVTSFLFRAHPVKTVCAGPTFWALEDGAEVLKVFGEFIADAPETVGGFFAFLTIPPAPMFPPALHNRKVCGIMWCLTAPPDEADKTTKAVRSIGKPLLDHVGEMPFPVLQSLFDPLYPAGLQQYWRADFVNKLNGQAIAAHMKHGSNLPTMLSTMHIYPINGAAQRAGKGDTAFSYRDADFAQIMLGADPDPANSALITQWCKDYFDALHPFSAGGAYVNFMMEEGQERVQASFRENYQRLATVKKQYDPGNFFRVNQNIRPA